MSRAGVTAWHRCRYCGGRSLRERACEYCSDLLELEPHALTVDAAARELELELQLLDLARASAREHDPRL